MGSLSEENSIPVIGATTPFDRLRSNRVSTQIEALREIEYRIDSAATSTTADSSDGGGKDGHDNKNETAQPSPAVLLPALLGTYTRHLERRVRKQIQSCLRKYIIWSSLSSSSSSSGREDSESIQNAVAEFLARESQKAVIAPTSALVLLELCATLLEVVPHLKSRSKKIVPATVTATALCLDKCLASDVRVGVRHAALTIVKRGLRKLVFDDTSDEAANTANGLLDETISVLTSATTNAASAPLLGLLASTCHRKVQTREHFQSRSDKIFDFYAKHVLSSKAVLPPQQVNSLNDFLSLFATKDAIATVAVPALEKAILRSPESVLQGPMTAFAYALPTSIDVSELVFSKLLRPLLSSLGSTNAAIREGAAKSLTAFLVRKEQSASMKIVNEVLSHIKSSKAASYDLRGLLCDSLCAVQPAREASTVIVTSLVPVAAKEANESALRREVAALCSHLVVLIESGTIDKATSDAILKGCGEKRPLFKKAWVHGVGAALLNIETIETGSQQFVSAALKVLQDTFVELSSNALPAVQAGTVSSAYVIPALLQSRAWKHMSVQVRVEDMLQPQSFLLNPKVFGRLSSVDDQRWALRALLGISKGLHDAVVESKTAWARAFMHLLLNPDTSPAIRRESGIELSKKYLTDPAAVGSSIVLGLWDLLQEINSESNKQTKSEEDPHSLQLRRAITCISPPRHTWEQVGLTVPQEVLDDQAASTVVLFASDLVHNTDWITNCLTIGVDPGKLASTRPDILLREINRHFDPDKMSKLSVFEIAACRAAATLTFVAPDVVAPLLIKQLSEDLNPSRLHGIGPTEAAIAYTPEGVLYVDPLSKTNGVVENKNVKDYNVLKWEEQLRAQIAQKKGAPPKKLTPDQQAKVDAQAQQENVTRRHVWQVSAKLRRGAGFVQALATGPPTDARLWMTPAVDKISAALRAGAALIVDDELVTAYLACAAHVQERIGSMRTFIGVATLRAMSAARLAPDMEAEALEELATRVLYRIRFASEQRPFDTASLAYALPLTFFVLDNGKIGEPSSSEDADAQVLLAIEFLSFQMSSCNDELLPRVDILQRLISCMQKYPQHHRLLRDSLTEFSSVTADNITPPERDLLLRAVTLPEVAARSAALQAIQTELELIGMKFSTHIWIACQDEDEDNADTALAIWEENQFAVSGNLIDEIPDFLFEQAHSTRVASAKALAQALSAKPEKVTEIRTRLQTIYQQESQPLVPKRDKFGIVQKGDLVDQWQKRSGLALAFKEMASVLSSDDVIAFMEFAISDGALSDRHPRVRDEMVAAGIQVVTLRGKTSLEPLMKLFEQVLQGPDKATQESDWINEAVIVLYGSLAQHLPKGDKRLKDVLAKLVGTLSTPSESVQYAVAGCLPQLVRAAGSDSDSYVSTLLEQLFSAKKYAARRGAAYGLAGIVKGKGLGSLRQFRILSALHGAADNKKSPEHREGAMLAYELLSTILARTFEPYVIDILPQLLACFGDQVPSVREACLDTAKACFASLSSYGVAKVLPQLLEGLDETQWRSKKGACDLLGAMAYLDPQQLATSLPDIIPPLTAVLTDTHKEVRAAANNSLKRFGEVISNPEVKILVDILLKALSDPNKYTDEALESLIKVSFVHYLDAPSLALVVRILQRGLADRSSTKRKAAQIIGSLAHLTEKRDIVTHLPILVVGLRAAAIDPVPATRATASKALGSLVEKLGEDAFPDLIPSLMSSLRTDTGAGDRLGSAQALSEVLAGLGTGRLEETLPTILQNVQSARATVREGFMTLFIFLPACFGNSFANYLGQIIPSILSGLADEMEAIRDVALRAGRLLVKNFASKAIDLLLPELQRGLADDSYRIRLSSVELVGDLLFSLTGISSKGEAEEEEESAAQAGQSLLEVLGEDRRNRVLSSLYICRCDTSGLVRAAAIAVWKALVATPRTLRELVPTLTQMLIQRLGSSNMEHKVIASNALGEVIRKAGDNIFTTLLPSLEEGLQASTNPDNRQGICIALREVVNAASPEALHEHEKKLIAIVRLALIDPNTDVREAAAESFDALQATFGRSAVDMVLPHLLNLLRNEDEAENALSALLTLLTEATRANAILPNLIPTLLTDPITTFNARALASLAKVGGSAMNRRLPAVLNTLADNAIKCKDEGQREELDTAFTTVLCAVDEYDGLNTAMSVMLNMIKNDDHRRRAVAARQFGQFFAGTEVDYSRYNQDLIRVLLISFDDRDKEVVLAAWGALSELQKHLKKEEMETLATSTTKVLRQVGTPGHNLPGFVLPKGIQPVLAILLQALMNGNLDQKLEAASGISDLIDKTSPDGLKAFVTQITGPLIRVVGERSTDIKSAIIVALNQLLEKIPLFLRPFLPQLQRTFTKCIADPSSETLRTRAIKALSTLVVLTPRVDPLVTELVTGVKTPDQSVRNAMLRALQEVVGKVGAKMSEASRDAILALMDSHADAQDEMMDIMAGLLGAMINVLPAGTTASLINSRVLPQPSTNASILALNAVLAKSPKALIPDFITEVRSVLAKAMDAQTFIQHQAVLATGKFLLGDDETIHADRDANTPIFQVLANNIQPGKDIDTRRLGLVVLRTVARHHGPETRQYLPILAQPVFACLRDTIIPIKLAAEAVWLEIFDVVNSDSEVFDSFLAEAKEKGIVTGPAPRAMADYFKRIALRLGAQKREQKEAEGGQGGLGLSSDEQDDEREIWRVGKVDAGEEGWKHE